MRIVKIFLASSAELDADKNEFENFVSKKNKTLSHKRIFLELVTWKDFVSAMTEEHSQEKYNKYIRSCDIAVFLFHTKLGKYTKEEFDIAHQAFKNSPGRIKTPLIYTYFKTDGNETVEITEIKKYIDNLGHFYDTYESLDNLEVKFNNQLDYLEKKRRIIIPDIIDVPQIKKYAVYSVLLPLLVLSGAFFSFYFFQPTDMTVRINEVRAIPNLPFKEGTVTLTYGDKTETKTIKEEVVFKQIPSKYKHKKAKLAFESTGYKSISDTTIYITDLLSLPVKRDNSLRLVIGWVRDESGNPLKDVSVMVKDLKNQTDENGRFRIEIPFEEQSDSIRLTAYLEGYKTWDCTGAPSQSIEWKIILQKK